MWTKTFQQVNFVRDIAARLLRLSISRIDEFQVTQIAGSLTFTTVLSVVPLLTVAFAIFSAFPIFAIFELSVRDFLSDQLMPVQLSEQILLHLDEFANKAKGMTWAGVFALVITALLTMTTIESTFNRIWHVKRARHPIQRVLVYWAILTLGPLLFGISITVSSYLWSQSLATVSETLAVTSSVRPILLSFAIIIVSAMGFTVLYLVVPNCYINWRDALVGGALAAVAFELVKRGFAFYISQFPTYTIIYGTFAAIPIFLIWVYLSWLITLIGALFVRVMPDMRAASLLRGSYPGEHFIISLRLLACLHFSRHAQQMGLTTQALAKKLNCSFDTILDILDKLEASQIIASVPFSRALPIKTSRVETSKGLSPDANKVALVSTPITKSTSDSTNDLSWYKRSDPEDVRRSANPVWIIACDLNQLTVATLWKIFICDKDKIANASERQQAIVNYVNAEANGDSAESLSTHLRYELLLPIIDNKQLEFKVCELFLAIQ